MKQSKIALRTAVVVAVVGLMGVLAVACGRPCAGRAMDLEKVKKFLTWRIDDVLDDIDATEEQRREIHAAKDGIFEDARKMKEDCRKDRLAFLAEIRRDDPDAERLHGLLDGHAEKIRAFAHRNLDNLLAVHAGLTTKQREMLILMVEERIKDR